MILGIGEDGRLVEKPEMLEQWLSTDEGRDYVSKNKLFHLLSPRTTTCRDSAIATASKHTASGTNLLAGLS